MSVSSHFLFFKRGILMSALCLPACLGNVQISGTVGSSNSPTGGAAVGTLVTADVGVSGAFQSAPVDISLLRTVAGRAGAKLVVAPPISPLGNSRVVKRPTGLSRRLGLARDARSSPSCTSIQFAQDGVGSASAKIANHILLGATQKSSVSVELILDDSDINSNVPGTGGFHWSAPSVMPSAVSGGPAPIAVSYSGADSKGEPGSMTFSIPCGDSGKLTVTGVPLLNSAAYHVVTGVYDGSTDSKKGNMKLYVDGSPIASATIDNKLDLALGATGVCSEVVRTSSLAKPSGISPAAAVLFDTPLSQTQAADQFSQLNNNDSSADSDGSCDTATDQIPSEVAGVYNDPNFGCIGYPGMLGWNIRLFSNASCSSLGGNWVGNGECLMPGGGSYSASLAYLNTICDPNQVSQADQNDFAIRLAFVKMHDRCGGMDSHWNGPGPSAIRLFSQSECNQMQGNWISSSGECLARGGGSYSAMMGDLNTDPRCTNVTMAVGS